jgi:hypothetical protein
MTMNREIQKALAAPFPEKRISWRIGRAGKNGNDIWIKALAYIDARDCMDRLDDVVGIYGWQDTYRKDGNSIICRLEVRTEGIFLYKEDASYESDIEAVKGGISGAFKRVCVKWGIGRYLYDLKEGFATVCDKNTDGAIYAKTQELGVFYWLPPKLPNWALIESEQASSKPKQDIHKSTQSHDQNSYATETMYNTILAAAEANGVPDMDIGRICKSFGANSSRTIPAHAVSGIIETLKRKGLGK